MPYTSPEKKSHHIPFGIWIIGLSSYFLTLSSIMLLSIMPFHMQALGATAATVGLMTGISEFIALSTRLFSGVISDWLHKRKILLVISYGLIALARPFFPLSTSINMLLIPRFIDRIGNGLQATPRDALVGDLAPDDMRGACFGLRESLTKAGSFSGALLTFGLLYYLGVDFHAVFWIATIPSFIAFVVLVVFVKEPTYVPPKNLTRKKKGLSWADLQKLPKTYWMVIGVVMLFVLGRSNEDFLILKTTHVGLSKNFAPITMAIMNLGALAASYPIGRLSDRLGRTSLLLCALLVMIAAQLVCARADSTPLFVFGTILWGIQLGMNNSLFISLIADLVPDELRGTGFGIYQLTFGIMGIPGGYLAGWLWKNYNPSISLMATSAIACLAFAALWFLKQKKHV